MIQEKKNKKSNPEEVHISDIEKARIRESLKELIRRSPSRKAKKTDLEK